MSSVIHWVMLSYSLGHTMFQSEGSSLKQSDPPLSSHDGHSKRNTSPEASQLFRNGGKCCLKWPLEEVHFPKLLCFHHFSAMEVALNSFPHKDDI